MKKIKKFKIKQNNNNEYSNYHYFIPKSEHIKFADARTLDTEIGDLRNQINELEEKTQYLIDKVPLIGFEEGESSLDLKGCANDEIRKVGIDGNSEQKTTEGYQLLNPTLETTSSYGVTCTKNSDGSYTLNGTSSARAVQFIIQVITLPMGTYRLNTSGIGYVYMRVWSNTQDKEIYKYEKSNVFTLEQEEELQIQIYCQRIDWTYSGTIYPMLTKGEEAQGEFEKYTGGMPSPNPDYPQDIEVIDGVNKFDKENEILHQFNANGVEVFNRYLLDSNGNITINFDNASYGRTMFNKIELEAGYYTLSFNARTSGTNKQILRSIRDMNTLTDILASSSIIIVDDDRYSVQFTLTKKTLVAFSINPHIKNTGNLILSNIQLTKGTTPKLYLPYGCIGLKHTNEDESKSEIIPINLNGNSIAKVGDVKDLLKVYRNGDVEIEKKIGKVVLDGSENWGTIDNKNTGDTFYSETSVIDNLRKGTSLYLYCDKFKNINDLWDNNNVVGTQMFNLESALRFRILKTELNEVTINGWKSWLSTHNTIVYYTLAEPQTIELNPINPIKLWEGTNKFELITNLDTTFKIIYKKDIDALIADSGA